MLSIKNINENDGYDPTTTIAIEDTERGFEMAFYGEVDIHIGKGRVWLDDDALHDLLVWSCGFGDANLKLSCDSNNPTFIFRRVPTAVNGVFGAVESSWGGVFILSDEDIVVIRNFLEEATNRAYAQ